MLSNLVHRLKVGVQCACAQLHTMHTKTQTQFVLFAVRTGIEAVSVGVLTQNAVVFSQYSSDTRNLYTQNQPTQSKHTQLKPTQTKLTQPWNPPKTKPTQA